jgi:hypothetical protein
VAGTSYFARSGILESDKILQKSVKVLLLKCKYEGVRVLLSTNSCLGDCLSENYYYMDYSVQQLIGTIEECVVAKSSFFCVSSVTKATIEGCPGANFSFL